MAANLSVSVLRAQSYNLDWLTLDGGGGTSSGGVYAVSDTIGQSDAARPVDQNGFAVPSTGGKYTLVGGFWSILQKGGAPVLKIKKQAGNVVLSWPAYDTGYALEARTTLNPSINWSNELDTPAIVAGQFTVTNSATRGNKFYRLKSQ